MPDPAFGRHLAMIRQACGMSQVELAERARIPAASISHFEAGRRQPSLANFAKIAEALGVSADKLLGIGDSVAASVHGLSARDRAIVVNLARLMRITPEVGVNG